MRDIREIREYYNNLSNMYDELYGFEQLSKYAMLHTYLSRINGAVLDAGAGTLLLLEYLHKTGVIDKINYYVAVDLSEKMLLKGVYSRKHLLNKYFVDIILCDLRYMCFRNYSFDSIICITVLTNNDSGLLNELIRICKKLVVITRLIPREKEALGTEICAANTLRFWVKRGVEEAIIIELKQQLDRQMRC